MLEVQRDCIVIYHIRIGGRQKVGFHPSGFLLLVSCGMRYGGDVRLPFPERIIYIKVKVRSYRYDDVVLFRCGLERPAVIGVFIVGGPVDSAFWLDGKYAYGIAFLKSPFLGASCPGGGKSDAPASGRGMLQLFPAGGYGQHHKQAAD